MSVPAIAPQLTAKPERQLKITKQVRVAVQAMVWDGLKRDEAAAKAGMKDNSLYVALRRPDVKAFYLAELDVLRTSERARNIHRAVEIREQSSNQMAALGAIKLLEQLSDGDNASGSAASHSPGVVIQIVTAAPTKTIEGVVSHDALAHD